MQFAMPKQTSFLGSFSNKVSPKRRHFTVRAPRSRCSSQLSDEQRRSGGYQPTLWDFDYIQSLNSQYEVNMHAFVVLCIKIDQTYVISSYILRFIVGRGA